MIKHICYDTRLTCFQQRRCGGISVPKQLLLTSSHFHDALSPPFPLHFLGGVESPWAAATFLPECETPASVLSDFWFYVFPCFGWRWGWQMWERQRQLLYEHLYHTECNAVGFFLSFPTVMKRESSEEWEVTAVSRGGTAISQECRSLENMTSFICTVWKVWLLMAQFSCASQMKHRIDLKAYGAVVTKQEGMLGCVTLLAQLLLLNQWQGDWKPVKKGVLWDIYVT